MSKKLSLPAQILVALVAGIAVGLVCYFTGAKDITTAYLKPFGDIFVNLLKFIVVPVVLLSMIDGIISMNDMRKVGSVGIKTVAYFMATTAIACVIGLVFANIFKAAGLFPVLDPNSAEYEAKEFGGFMSTLVSIFPTNMWKSFTDANMLQVIVISLLFGGSILAAGEKARLCRDFVSSAYAVTEKLMGFIISLAPIGVFTYMAILHSLWRQMQIYENIRLMEVQRQDYDALCQKMEVGRIYRHDMRHHLAAMEGLLQYEDNSGALQYVRSLSGGLEEITEPGASSQQYSPLDPPERYRPSAQH